MAIWINPKKDNNHFLKIKSWALALGSISHLYRPVALFPLIFLKCFTELEHFLIRHREKKSPIINDYNDIYLVPKKYIL